MTEAELVEAYVTAKKAAEKAAKIVSDLRDEIVALGCERLSSDYHELKLSIRDMARLDSKIVRQFLTEEEAAVATRVTPNVVTITAREIA